MKQIIILYYYVIRIFSIEMWLFEISYFVFSPVCTILYYINVRLNFKRKVYYFNRSVRNFQFSGGLIDIVIIYFLCGTFENVRNTTWTILNWLIIYAKKKKSYWENFFHGKLYLWLYTFFVQTYFAETDLTLKFESDRSFVILYYCVMRKRNFRVILSFLNLDVNI